MKVVSCDQPAWVFLGLSMAGWNAVAAGGLTLISAVAAFGRRKPA
jgi:disulfide bond formation protein DsbB